jgi:hypothetical protein
VAPMETLMRGLCRCQAVEWFPTFVKRVRAARIPPRGSPRVDRLPLGPERMSAIVEAGDIVLTRFRLREQLGRRASGAAIWRVETRDAEGRAGVLKLAPSGSLDGDDIRKEAELLATVSGTEAREAHIAPMLDHGEDDGFCWLLQQDVGRMDLARHWARERPGFHSVLDVGQAIATALAFLHRHGVLHRDVKEANIVIADGRGPDQYWLVDLGIGRRLDQRPAVTMDMRGSYDRVPPEALTAGRKVGPPGDVFVLCKLLVQGLVGSPNVPWPDDVDAQLLRCGLNASEPRHLALVRLLTRGMRLDPSTRPSAAELARGFEDIRRGRVGPSRRRWLPAATFLAGGFLAALLLLRPEAQAPTSIAFEDASEAWNLSVAAPDAMPREDGAPPTSGLYWLPTLLDTPSGPMVYLPRASREYSAMPPPLRRDLVATIQPDGLQWSFSELPEASANTNWIERGDYDGDGAWDTLVAYHDERWIRHVRLLLTAGTAPVELGPMRWPFAVPLREGTALVGMDPPWVAAEDLGAWRAKWGAHPSAVPHREWLDLEGDGNWELLTLREQRPALLRWSGSGWHEELLADRRVLNAGPAARWNQMEVADLDGDGDEDLVTVLEDERTVVIFERIGEDLVLQRGAALELLDDDEEALLGFCAIQAVDLDGDGLPELLAPSGGLAHKGAYRSKVWRNLGGLRFERVELPPRLATPHDGCWLLPVDVDGDGALDLLDFSLNDEEREVPTHRAWRGLGGGEHAQWPLRILLPGERSLPLGTRIESITGRRWTRTVRNSAPLYVPSWLASDLLITLPSGEIHIAVLGSAVDGPRTVHVEVAELPVLLGPGRQPIRPSLPLDAPDDLVYHALQDDWEVLLRKEGASTLAIDGAIIPLDLFVHSEGLGCPTPDRCVFLEQRSEGGYTPVELSTANGILTRLPAEGDSAVTGLARLGRAWSVSGHLLRERDPVSYAEIHPDRIPEPRVVCDGLAFDGTTLACSSDIWDTLVLYDPDSLVARARYELAVPLNGDVLPIPEGWLAVTGDGLAWIEDSGSVVQAWLGEAPLLVQAGGGAWAIGEHRALWLDLTARRVVGGLVAPNLQHALPVPATGGELGRL